MLGRLPEYFRATRGDRDPPGSPLPLTSPDLSGGASQLQAKGSLSKEPRKFESHWNSGGPLFPAAAAIRGRRPSSNVHNLIARIRAATSLPSFSLCSIRFRRFLNVGVQ